MPPMTMNSAVIAAINMKVLIQLNMGAWLLWRMDWRVV
jgi:hypothetical protein